ncbi:MAG: hypothetical protein LKF01_00910 [Lactobacillus sp.]|jgi:hypothetical protein|nr:hypothetical protein [Lactobacillus sp.]MCH3906631.1 hypothetical protein [Lactobacillus sp.]MCH3989733.1 hypothetical protein [Lactobacillus sp.]MCH4068101.1 hypothetical protein [Lactobacillus sp.]MCI1304282.1 hypothetical protein [Lactobacillus sp.]
MSIERVETPVLHFVGRVFTDHQMNKSQSFQAANQACEKDPALQELFAQVDANQRANLVVFGPTNFTYWYGVVSKDKIEKPDGLLAYDLPAAVCAEETTAGGLGSFSLPLGPVLLSFLQKTADAGFKLYANLGDSETPYILRTVDLEAKKMTTRVYLAAK